MTLIIEDGSIVTGAQSYGTVIGLQAYALARGKTILAGKEEEYLLRSMDVIEFLPLPGTRYSKEQPLQWPRYSVYIDGFAIDIDEIPNLLIEVQYEGAIAINEGYDPIAVTTRLAKRVTVGPITKEYADDGLASLIYQPFYNKLQKLLGSNPNNGFEFTVSPA